MTRRMLSLIVSLALVVPACNFYEEEIYAQEKSSMKLGYSLEAITSAHNFIHSSNVPDFLNAEEWLADGESKAVPFPFHAETKKETDDKSWILEKRNTLSLIFQVSRYRHKKIPLIVTIYRIESRDGLKDVYMTYHTFKQEGEGVVGRLAAFYGNRWIPNKSLYDSKDNTTGLRLIEIVAESRSKDDPLSVKFKFLSVEGEKDIEIFFPTKEKKSGLNIPRHAAWVRQFFIRPILAA